MANERRLIDADALDNELEALKVRFKALGRDNVVDDYNFVQTVLLTAPTVDAEPVVYGRWVSMGAYQGHKCGVCNDYYTDDAVNLFYCPRCGAKMVEIEKLDYRRKDMPIGAPWKKTVCEHGRSEDDGKTD